MSVDSSGNQKVDFAWGNIPLQPNDDRGGSGALIVEAPNLDQNRGWSGYTVYPSQFLNEALDNHLLVSTGHNGYPDYLPGDIDAVPGDIPIPDLVGGNVEFAITQWENAGFNGLNVTINYLDNNNGATAENNGLVASQSPTAGHTADVDHVITLNVYAYTPVNEVLFTIQGGYFYLTSAGEDAWMTSNSNWPGTATFLFANYPTDGTLTSDGNTKEQWVGKFVRFYGFGSLLEGNYYELVAQNNGQGGYLGYLLDETTPLIGDIYNSMATHGEYDSATRVYLMPGQYIEITN